MLIYLIFFLVLMVMVLGLKIRVLLLEFIFIVVLVVVVGFMDKKKLEIISRRLVRIVKNFLDIFFGDCIYRDLWLNGLG